RQSASRRLARRNVLAGVGSVLASLNFEENGETMTNLQRLQAALRTEGTPAYLVSDIAGVQWATGFTGSYGFAIVTREKGVLVTDSRYTMQAGEQTKDFEVRSFANPTDVTDFLRDQLRSLNITRLGFDENTVTVATHRKWTEKFTG